MSNPVSRWQIITKNPERHSAFYRDVFGWSISADNPLNYREAKTGDGPLADGGFWPAPPEAPNFVQLFIKVDDVAKCIERAKQNGGDVIIGAQHLPNGEVMAILRDCEGMSFGVYQSK